MALCLGNDHAFAQMPDDLIGHDEDRRPVLFAQIESGDGLVENLLGRGRRQSDDFVMAVGTPSGLHHVALGAQRGESRGWAGPLNVHQDARRFGADAQSEVFHHQAEAGAGGGRHALHSRARSPENGGHGGDLVFHLDIMCHRLRGVVDAMCSAISVAGVMGYPPKNRQPAASAPSAQATSPVMKCSPVKTAGFIC